MTLHYRTYGFVLKKEDRFEADRVFSVFTKEFGRVEVTGRAIRKIASKLRGGIDLFSLSEVEFIQGKNKKTLTDAITIETYKNILESPEKLQVAYKISDMVACFVKEQQQDETIFNLLQEALGKLNEPQLPVKTYPLAYYYFLWNFVSALGYAPELSVCAVCAEKLNPQSLYFSNKEGGAVCQTCAAWSNAVKITSDVVKVARLLLKKDWDMLKRLTIGESAKRQLEKVSEEYLAYLISSHAS